MKNPYDTLGVDKNATQDEIKKAFRDQSKLHHPDKGGDEEKFKNLGSAMEILRDPKKRKRYDETGETKEDSFEAKFQQFIMGGLTQLEHVDDIECFDLMKLLTDAVENAKKSLLISKREISKSIEKYEKAVKRISRKDGNSEKNIILHLMESKLDGFKKSKISCDKELDFIDKVTAALLDYEFDFEAEVIVSCDFGRGKDASSIIIEHLHNGIRTSKSFDDFMNKTRGGGGL